MSWRYARGIISSDDSLFDRWEAPHLDRVILDPVREADAGKHKLQGVQAHICSVDGFLLKAFQRKVRRFYELQKKIKKSTVKH